MKTLKVIECVGLISLVLSTCSWSVRTLLISVQKQGENTKVAQIPVFIKPEQSNKTSTQEKPSQKVAIADLADGNYQFCTKPPSYQASSGLDVKGWCFIFRKAGERAIGIYTFWAPSDYAQICINGTAKGNTVSGSGYEIVEGGSEPITDVDITKLSRGGIWDNWNGEGNNLRVDIPHLYSTNKYPSGGYYAWIRYESVQLDLSKFYQRDVGKLIPPKKCPN